MTAEADPRLEELRRLRDRGLSQERAARALGITQSGVWSRCKRLGFRWPPVDEVRVSYGDARLTLPELSRATGIAYTTLYRRYHHYGWRGDALVAPPNATRAKPREWRTGLTEGQWQVVLDALAREKREVDDVVRARKRIASRFALAYGAVAAADRDEWHRIVD